MRDYSRMGAHPLVSDSEKGWLRVLATLNELQARLFVAQRALELGRGGVSKVSRLPGMSRPAIYRGIAELRGKREFQQSAEGSRIRRAGGGRKSVAAADPEILRQLRRILEETTAGEPMSLLKWTGKSTRTIAAALTPQGHPVSAMTVCRCLWQMGYSLHRGETASGSGCAIPLHPPASEVFPAEWGSGDLGRYQEKRADWSLSQCGPDLAATGTSEAGVDA